jgi:hypothetical protein
VLAVRSCPRTRFVVLLRSQRHVREVQESVIASAYIRASFVATTKHARSLAAISGRRTEDDTTDLLRYAVEAWFRMRGPDFVVKTRKRHNIRIYQQSKSMSLRIHLYKKKSLFMSVV